MRRTRTTTRPPGTLPDGTPIPPPQPDDRLERFARIDDAIHAATWRARRRRDLVRTLIESVILLGVGVWAIAGGGRPVTMAFALLLIGPAVGLAIHALDAGPFRTGVLGAIGYGLCMPPAYGYGLTPWLVLGVPATFILFVMYGLRRAARAVPGAE